MRASVGTGEGGRHERRAENEPGHTHTNYLDWLHLVRHHLPGQSSETTSREATWCLLVPVVRAPEAVPSPPQELTLNQYIPTVANAYEVYDTRAY